MSTLLLSTGRGGRTVLFVEHVLWIGGPPGSGKTTVATRLVRRYGLRLYSADTRTWVHRDRALDAGVEAAHRWEKLAPAARWQRQPEELVEMSLHVQRGPMVIEDLKGLPVSPLVLAEGSTLPPAAITSGTVDRARAVWLLPTAEFQEAQLAANGVVGGPAKLYRLLRESSERDAHQHGVTTLSVDGSVGVPEMVGAVERLFRDALVAGPLANTLAERRQLLRELNEAVIDQVRGYYARPWAEGDSDLAVQLFVCECASPECDVDLRVSIEVASAAPVLAPGHG